MGVLLGTPPQTVTHFFPAGGEAKPRLQSSASPSPHPPLESPFSLLPSRQGDLLTDYPVNEVVWLMDTNRYCFLTCKMNSTVTGSNLSMLMLNEPVVYLFLFTPADPLATFSCFLLEY